MLCYRCEHRAMYLHTKGIWQPRCECGDVKSSKHACYMYKPVLPVVTKPLDKNDKRPRFAGAMISSREKVVRVAKGKLKGRELKNGEVVLYWSNLR